MIKILIASFIFGFLIMLIYLIKEQYLNIFVKQEYKCEYHTNYTICE